MNDLMIEQGPRTIECSPSAAADITVSDGFKRLPLETRRRVDKWVKKGTLTLSALSLILTSGCGNTQPAEPQIIPEPTPFTAPETTPTPFPTITPMSASPELSKALPLESAKYFELSDGMKITLDLEGLPLKFTLPNGHEVFFDKKGIKKLRERAIFYKEPEIIRMFPVDQNVIPKVTSLPLYDYFNMQKDERLNPPADREDLNRHPKTLELPKDVLSDEELETRGVKIIQSDNTTLYIREGAFEKGAPLENFNNSGRNLTIVLVNGLTVDPYYMQDAKYSEVIKILPSSLQKPEDLDDRMYKYRQKNISSEIRGLERARLSLIKYPMESKHTEASLFYIKEQLFLYQKAMSKDALLESMTLTDWNNPFIGVTHLYLSGDNPYIFISTGKKRYDFDTLYFDSKGTAWLNKSIYQNINLFLPPPMNPTSAQTYLSPEDVQPQKTDDVFTYYPQTPGLNLRRAVKIDELITQKGGNASDPTRDEIDLKVMKDLESARNRLIDSGYADNSGYPFVFSLPKEQGGGYILTRKDKNRQKKLRRKLRAKNLKEISS